ncbi:pyrroline-5-carboxylate reductase [bacterium 336/3]|nr:pyrroline-5-carboxylate reductase [bacterium 336/3]
MRILIIGGGNMGKTYADNFIANHAVKPEDLHILVHRPESVTHFLSLGFKNVYHEVGEYIRNMELIILSVKPQDTKELFPLLVPFIHEKQMILSVMAGVKMENIQKALPQIKKIVRAMPNLPSMIGMGMTGFTSTENVNKSELFWIHNLLNTTGKSLYFDNENQLDAVTAISGSGPAYVYYFMDAMIKAAIHMGFTQNQAEVLVEQTFLGAVHLKKRNDLTCQEWIQKVASKGGTTEAALERFEVLEVNQGIEKGLEDAFKRAVELGN